MLDYFMVINDFKVDYNKLDQTYNNIDWVKQKTLKSPVHRRSIRLKKERNEKTLNWMQDDFWTYKPSPEDYEFKLVIDFCKQYGVYDFLSKNTTDHSVIGPTWCRYGAKTRLGIHKDHPAVLSNGQSRGCWLAICYKGSQPLIWYDDDKNKVGEVTYSVLLSNALKFHFADIMNTGEERILIRTTFDQPYIDIRDRIIEWREHWN